MSHFMSSLPACTLEALVAERQWTQINKRRRPAVKHVAPGAKNRKATPAPATPKQAA